MGVVAIPALLIGALVISVAIAIKNQQNNSKPGSSSPSDVFDDLDKVFKRQETSCVLNCDKGSGKLETPIHQPDTRPYVNPPYFDDELDAYVHPMQPDEDLDKYTYIKPGVYYDPETGRYVTPIHETNPADLAYNSTAAEFEKSISKLPPGERVAAVKTKTKEIADLHGWEKDNKLSTRNNRVIYEDDEGNFYAVDTQHGRFEKLNKRGKHQGEYNIDLEQIPDSKDTSGRHDIIL